jgi:hypothetical protein
MPDVVNETPREILAAEKDLDAAELRYQTAVAALKTLLGPSTRAVASQLVRDRRADRDRARQLVDALREGGR